jgi:LysM repeat protein
MRLKLFAILVLLLALTAVAGMGWYKWQAIQKQEALNDELKRCRNWITLNQHEKAQGGLERVLSENPDLAARDAIIATLAGSYETTGDDQKALERWREIFTDFPTSRHMAQAVTALAAQSLAAKDYAKAQEFWGIVLTQFSDSEYVDDAKLGRARMLYDQEELIQARDALWAILDEHPDSDQLDQVEQLIGKISVELLYSPALAEEEGDLIYKIASGDTLASIGRRFGVSYDLLMTINHIADERNLTVGKRLKIPNVDFSILVDKTENKLHLMNKGKLFKTYRIRTGKDDWRTPTGAYSVLRKVKDPTWNKPGGRSYPPGDPENALGSRWMAFEGSMLGIHGTNKAETIGTYASEGCVGLLNEEVEELYDLVPRGTKVEIVGKMKKDHGQQEDE